MGESGWVSGPILEAKGEILEILGLLGFLKPLRLIGNACTNPGFASVLVLALLAVGGFLGVQEFLRRQAAGTLGDGVRLAFYGVGAVFALAFLGYFGPALFGRCAGA